MQHHHTSRRFPLYQAPHGESSVGGNVQPLSPHIQIYRWLWSSTGSIVHRATGVALAFGLVFVSLWIVVTAHPILGFDQLRWLTFSLVGRFGLVILLWCTFYHLLNGIRHIAWDFDYGFSLGSARRSFWIVSIGSLIATGLTVFLAFVV